MRLTHIKLTGFKSFTDPTTIHVPGQLVAVIGPNGCGKSNVIDAVRWVLGEASAKQLRGESMQDVIFNGAATRRPAPRASVELVFNNADQSLQGPWGKYTEVSIKRQLTRQGESTYYINNQVVRRRDITDLFLGTGVGARGYAVIEQGMISRIIEAKPEELRAYIEEAAGVSKYKERRKETEARLKDTREHLQRLSDLQTELARQVEKLEKQAETAERYQTLTEQLAQQQDLLDYTQWQQSLAAADKATQQHRISQQKQDETAKQNQAAGEALHALRDEEHKQQQQAQETSNQRAMLREQIARLEEQLRSQHNLQQRIQRDRQAAQAQLQRIYSEKQNILNELETLETDLEDKQVELAEWAMQVAEREESLPELETAQNTLSASFQAQQDELNRIKRELALKQQRLAHASQTLKQHDTRKERLNQEAQSLNLPPEAEISAAQEQAEILQAEHEHYEQQLLDSEERYACLKENVQTGISAYNDLYQKHITLQAEQQAIGTLLQNSSPNHDFWQQTPHATAPALWEHIKAPDDWQHALAAFLETKLQAKALNAESNLPTPLPQGSAAWFYTDLSSSRKTQPAQALINQIQATQPYQAALTYWLDGVLCAPSLDYALQNRERLQGHQRWLTPEGHQIDAIGVVLYAEKNGQNLIELKNRQDSLNEQLQAIAPLLKQAEQNKQEAQTTIEAHETQHKTLQAQHRQHAAQLHAAQAKATELLTRTNQGQLRREHIEQELLLLEEDQITLEHSSDSLQNDIESLTEAATELESQQNALNSTRQSRQNELKQAQLALLEANRRYGVVEVAVHKQQQRKQSLEQHIATLEQQTLDWQERQTELALAYETEEQDCEQREKLEVLTEQVAVLEEQYLAIQECLSETQQRGRELYAKQQTLAAALPQLQAATQTALLQQQEALINAKRHHQNLEERHADFDALAKLAGKSGLKELSGGIRSLAQQIEALGAVNLAALKELEEARERDGYYRSQSEDVQSAIDLLEEAIGQIDNETKQRFKETFDAVNEKVQTFFPTLFGGGEATLHMIGDDLLTAGVSIMARPPGKKNSTIHLLSGGEKALTAMSLVFALFSLNPAPFCLLDEVDAPLDDANTGRFCNLVKEMSAQTQFLYIPHNRLTMEMAEQLIGVTMQEKGVSRIVAVDIQQALSMAEA
ncbi:chromosome segregation protein SMC [Neisseria canis]|uniref:chromosome segregation protein SMC n=1 Tax=Neisseria canis TaxID=493 RepID=UPI000A192285|nr:chromosome segregation protein SMC [Neisseria canis]OSI11718.1 chromosome segregation protein SMC [Neisseria canis]